MYILALAEKRLANLLEAIEQGILTPTTKQRLDELEARKEALNTSILEEGVTFIVTVGMDACHLGKYILAHNRFIGRDYDTRVGLHHTADVVQAAFVLSLIHI